MSSRRCAFIQARACPVDVDEIPLDVCRLCIDAWKISAEIQTLTGADILGPTIMVPIGTQALQMIPSSQSPQTASQSKPLTLIPNIEDDAVARETQEMLTKLDNEFINDMISADEYVEKRRQLVNQLTLQKDSKKPSLLARATSEGYLEPEDSIPTGPPDDYFKAVDFEEEARFQGYKKLLPLLIIGRKEGKLGVTKYPEDWSPPRSLNRSNLESVYDLYDQLRENQEKILVQFNGTKLGILGKKNNRILCLVLEGNEKIGDYKEEIKSLTELLTNTTNFEEFLKALPDAMNKTKDLSFN